MKNTLQCKFATKTESKQKKKPQKVLFLLLELSVLQAAVRRREKSPNEIVSVGSISGDLAIPSHSCKFLCSGLAKLLFFFAFVAAFSVCLSCFVIRIMQIQSENQQKSDDNKWPSRVSLRVAFRISTKGLITVCRLITQHLMRFSCTWTDPLAGSALRTRRLHSPDSAAGCGRKCSVLLPQRLAVRVPASLVGGSAWDSTVARWGCGESLQMCCERGAN